MNKQVILALLLIVAVGVVAKQLFFSADPAANYETPQQAQAKAEAEAGGNASASGKGTSAAKDGADNGAIDGDVDLDELAKSVKVVDFLYDQTTLPRNPMTPLVGPQAVYASAPMTADAASGGAASPLEAASIAMRLAVTGIIWDKKFPVAVINDDVVAPGDTLPEGAVVQAIEPDRVVLRVGQVSVPISLKHTEEQ